MSENKARYFLIGFGFERKNGSSGQATSNIIVSGKETNYPNYEQTIEDFTNRLELKGILIHKESVIITFLTEQTKEEYTEFWR